MHQYQLQWWKSFMMVLQLSVQSNLRITSVRAWVWNLSMGLIIAIRQSCQGWRINATVRMIFGRDLEQRGKCLLILVDRWPNLLCNLEGKVSKKPQMEKRLNTTCWLINNMAISCLWVNSWKAASITDTCVSSERSRSASEQNVYECGCLLASTTKKFFFCCPFRWPMPANRRPVIES